MKNHGGMTNLESKVHPNHYLIHKYWSRKPHNIVNYYIQKYTRQENVVLDPYMGSGVVILEALKLKRKTIGIDLNPIACFLINSMIEKVDVTELKNICDDILISLNEINNFYYKTNCPKCNKDSIIITSLVEESVRCNNCGYDNYISGSKRIGNKYYCKNCGSPLSRINEYISYNYIKIKGSCPDCGHFIKNYQDKDNQQLTRIHEDFINFKNIKGKWIPTKRIESSIKRSGKEMLYELFSERNIIVINSLIEKIYSITKKEIRDCLLINLTASLPNMSRMIPADKDSIRGKSGWQIPKYYIFPSHIEMNVISAYKKRFDSNLAGWNELAEMDIERKDALILNQSSISLSYIKDESIDYIFTDPPYGKTIHYLSLSDIWNSILDFNVNKDEEIIWDESRKKTLERYYNDLLSVFEECFRVLKKDKFMSLTFNARDLKLVRILINSCINSGFNLIDVDHIDFAVSSATQGLNWKNTLKGDFIFTFQKGSNKGLILCPILANINEQIVEDIREILNEKGPLEFGNLYALLIPRLVKKGFFNDDSIDKVNIDELLELNFTKEINSKVFWNC